MSYFDYNVVWFKIFEGYYVWKKLIITKNNWQHNDNKFMAVTNSIANTNEITFKEFIAR